MEYIKLYKYEKLRNSIQSISITQISPDLKILSRGYIPSAFYVIFYNQDGFLGLHNQRVEIFRIFNDWKILNFWLRIFENTSIIELLDFWNVYWWRARFVI